MLKKKNLHELQLLVESYINYTEETKNLYLHRKRVEMTNTLTPALFLL